MQHFWIELMIGIAAWWFYRHWGVTFSSIYFFVVFTSLTIVSFIDIEFKIIPDVISISGIIIGLVVAALMSWIAHDWPVTVKQSLAGAFFGGGLLWGVAIFYEKLTGREGIGFGDVKLLAMFGANTGVSGVLTSLFFGSLLGSIFGLALILFKGKTRRTPIPFGPYLCLGLLIYGFVGESWFKYLAVQDLFHP